MSTAGIGGKVRENQEINNSKYVGLFEAEVIAINPSVEEYKSILGIELKEDSKAAEYLGENRDGNTFLRIDFWLKNLTNETANKLKVTYFLENAKRENKDGTKYQYINNVGNCSWAEDEEGLPGWFKTRDFRQANSGEEDLYNFAKIWLGKLDFRDTDTVFELDFKKLMKGNIKELKEQIRGDYCTNVVGLATVAAKEKDGEIKEYQGVYNKVLPTYCFKQFRLLDYSNPEVFENLKIKAQKDLKIHEKFVTQLYSEYGCKDFFTLLDIKEYDSSENFAASNKEIDEDNDSSNDDSEF